MIIRILRLTAWPAIGACIVAAAACSNPPPAPRAFVYAVISPGSNGSAVCQFGQDQTFVQIGTPTGPIPTTVIDGNTQAGAAVHVNCSVSPNGDGFNLQLTSTIEGLSGGTMTVTGHVTSQGGQGLSGTFTSADNGTFADSSGCTLSYTSVDGPPPLSPAVAAGRIWGHVSCPTSVKNDQFVPNPDGGAMIMRTCDAEADFLFEQCGQ